MQAERFTLTTLGLPSSERMFGSMTDVTQNGRMPGGMAVDATDPGNGQERVAGKVDKRGLVDLHSSPVSWIVLAIVAFVFLNARARRTKRG